MNRQDKKERGASGLGFLFKRGRAGERIPAESKSPGVFYIRARWADGKVADRRLVDEEGNSIRELREAKATQRRVRAPFLTGSRLAEVEAQITEAERLRRKEAEELDIANPPLAIRSAWAEYIRTPNRRQCGADTLANYERHWGQFVRWLRENHKEARYLRNITDRIAEEYAAYLTGLGYSGNTYNKHISFLRQFFRLLSKPARMTGNPFSEIQRRRQVPQSRRTLTLEEVRRVITSATGELRTLLEIGFYTGLRLGDCCTLEWSEINLDKGVVRRMPRKTSNTSGAVVEIGIGDAFRRILESIPRNGKYVLPETAQRYLRYRPGVGRTIMAHFRKCGFQVHDEQSKGNRIQPIVRVSFYSLRHTWVSRETEEGTPATLVQKAAGHSSPAMTEHYTHIGETGLRKMASAVDVDFSDENRKPKTDDAELLGLLERLMASGITPEQLQRLLDAIHPK